MRVYTLLSFTKVDFWIHSTASVCQWTESISLCTLGIVFWSLVCHLTSYIIVCNFRVVYTRVYRKCFPVHTRMYFWYKVESLYFEFSRYPQNCSRSRGFNQDHRVLFRILYQTFTMLQDKFLTFWCLRGCLLVSINWILVVHTIITSLFVFKQWPSQGTLVGENRHSKIKSFSNEIKKIVVQRKFSAGGRGTQLSCARWGSAPRIWPFNILIFIEVVPLAFLGCAYCQTFCNLTFYNFQSIIKFDEPFTSPEHFHFWKCAKQ